MYPSFLLPFFFLIYKINWFIYLAKSGRQRKEGISGRCRSQKKIQRSGFRTKASRAHRSSQPPGGSKFRLFSNIWFKFYLTPLQINYLSILSSLFYKFPFVQIYICNSKKLYPMVLKVTYKLFAQILCCRNETLFLFSAAANKRIFLKD